MKGLINMKKIVIAIGMFVFASCSSLPNSQVRVDRVPQQVGEVGKTTMREVVDSNFIPFDFNNVDFKYCAQRYAVHSTREEAAEMCAKYVREGIKFHNEPQFESCYNSYNTSARSYTSVDRCVEFIKNKIYIFTSQNFKSCYKFLNASMKSGDAVDKCVYEITGKKIEPQNSKEEKVATSTSNSSDYTAVQRVFDISIVDSFGCGTKVGDCKEIHFKLAKQQTEQTANNYAKDKCIEGFGTDKYELKEYVEDTKCYENGRLFYAKQWAQCEMRFKVSCN